MLTLIFAIQGHEDEVASVGSSLASYFSVFHRLLGARLRAMAHLCCSPAATTGQPSDLPSLAQELVDSCGHSLHTYLHAQVHGSQAWLVSCMAQHPA